MAICDLGIVRPGSTIYLPFHTFDSNKPSASVTLTGLATSDILIYKDGSTTQRASTSGYTLLDTDGIDFDATTGIHGISIDLADNTTAGFYAAGSQYWVVIASVTVDAATINFVLCTFRIGLPDAVLNTTIATLSTQTSFTLTAGPAEDDALNGCIVYIHDVASAVQGGFAVVQDYTGASKTVTLAAGTTFTAAASDNIMVFPPALVPTVLGRTLDVSTGGEAGIDWANIGSPTTAQNLSATNIDVDQVVASVSGAVGSVTGNVGGNVNGSVASVSGLTAATVHADLDDIQSRLPAALTVDGNIKADTLRVGGTLQTAGDIIGDTDDIQSRLPAALVGGRIDASVGAMAANVLTATAIAADAITDAKVAADVTIASVTGSVGSVTGLTAATVHADLDDIQSRLPAALVGGRIDASVGAMAANVVTAAAIADGALDAPTFTAVIGTGTCAALSTTTSIIASTVSPASAVNDQFKGRLIIFDRATSTAALRGQATDITAYTHATLTFTVTALTTAPAAGDTFHIM